MGWSQHSPVSPVTPVSPFPPVPPVTPARIVGAMSTITSVGEKLKSFQTGELLIFIHSLSHSMVTMVTHRQETDCLICADATQRVLST